MKLFAFFTLIPAIAIAVQNKTSLLTADDLSGGAVQTPGPIVVESGRGSVNTAMLTALQTAAQVRRIELYLKSGPAQTGDLRVVESSKAR